MIDYESKTINELMGMYNPIFEAREDAMTADYNELFCVWMYDLITDIEDSEPEPKYTLGQQVWVIHPTKRQPWIDEVIGIKVRGDGFQYVLPTYAFYEWDVYPTRKALIEAQLWYWTKFLAEEMHGATASCCSVHAGGYEECARPDDTHKKPEECVHESDGYALWVNPGNCVWFLDGESHDPCLPRFRECKKCGEFYK